MNLSNLRNLRLKTDNDRSSVPLLAVYRKLLSAFGPQHWWPADTPFEVMVGAVLTQNTAWPNVEKAIANLRWHGSLSPRAIHSLPARRLQQLLKPSGYFRVKARRLRSFVDYFLERYQSQVGRMRRRPLSSLRPELLAVHGIGRETADSILLYALDKPVFVVDAYTRRILTRHNWVSTTADYESVRSLFEENLPRSVRLYNEYHALLVHLGKTNCRPKPDCADCPLVTESRLQDSTLSDL